MRLLITLIMLSVSFICYGKGSEKTPTPIVSKEHHAWFTAVGNNDIDSVRVMISSFDIDTVGAHPESGYYEYTALMLASSLGNLKMVNELLKYGAKINIETKNGSALLSAAKNSKLDILTLLLVSGASIDIKNIDEADALIVASCNGNFDIVAMLLTYGSDVSVKDIRGNTAFDCAKKNNHKDVIKLFEYYNQTSEDIEVFLRFIAEQIFKSKDNENKADENMNGSIDN